MKNNNKHYIPEISEFYVGFECEVIDLKGVSDNPYYDWEYRIITDIDLSHNTFLEDYDGFYSLPEALEEEKIRVKYLDQSDIKSLGFVKGSVWYTHEIGVRLAISKSDEMHIKIEKLYTDSHWNLVFDGIIKNRSELKKVLKMIGI